MFLDGRTEFKFESDDACTDVTLKKSTTATQL